MCLGGATRPEPETMDEKKAAASMGEEASDLCKEMFGRVSDYLSGELAATESEYQLLRRLNQISLAKYADMSELAGRLNEVAQRLNDKCESIDPFCRTGLISLFFLSRVASAILRADRPGGGERERAGTDCLPPRCVLQAAG